MPWDLTDPVQLRGLLKRHGLWADKKFGQNFLIDQRALDAIMTAGEITASDEVIEIGPGPGVLTQQLAKSGAKVTAVEFDRRVIPALRDSTEQPPNLKIIQQDIRRFQPPASGSYKLIANIPYYLTSPILRQFWAENPNPPSIAVLMVQLEVGEKLTDPDRRSILQLQVSLFADAEFVRRVPASSFYPAPEVESAIVKITRRKEPLVPAEQIEDFFKLVKLGFANPRKQLGSSLAGSLRMEKPAAKALLEAAGIDPNLRAENLAAADWLRLLAERAKTN